MSAINLYFGQNAVSSLYQHQTPQKHSNYLNTNTSLGYSSFASSSQFRSPQLKSQQFTHITLAKDSPYSDAQSQREYIMQNNSQVTLNPVDSEDEINKFKQMMKLVQHLNRENQQVKSYANTKVKFLLQLREHVQNLEMKVAKQKKKYETDKKELQARQDKLIKRKRKRQSLIQQQLEQMVYVMKMRYSLSKNKHKKQSPSHKHKRAHSQKHNNFGHHQDYSNTYPLQHNPNNVHKNAKEFVDNPQSRIAQIQQIARAPFHIKNSIPHYSIYNPENKESFSMNSAKINQSVASKISNPFHLLAQKLSLESHTLFNNSAKKQPQEEGIIKTKGIIQLEMQQAQMSANRNFSNLNKYGSLNIRINQARNNLQLEDKEPDLAYFQENQNQASKIMGKSLKVLQEQRENSDHQDMNQMVSLLQQSIRNSSKIHTIQTNKVLKVQPDNKATKKSDMAFNLIETNMGEDFIFTLPEYSRQRSRLNSSKIDNSIDSEQRRQRQSRSQESSELKSKKQFSRNDFLAQSNININMQQTVQSPLNSQGNPFNLARKVESCSPQQILSNIQEVEEDIISRQNTPIDLTNIYEFAQSQNRIRKSKEQQKILRSSSNNMSDSNQLLPKNLPLSRPPSLKEEENASSDISYSQYGLNTIKLQTVSRLSREGNQKNLAENPKPEVGQIENTYKKSQREGMNIKIVSSKINEDFDEDDLFGIKLVTQSKISRESKTRFKNILQNSKDLPDLNYSEDFLPLQSKGDDMMSKSQPMSHKIKKTNHELEVEQNPSDQIDTIRKSTTSSIVRKGSAIKKIKDRQQVNSLKVSNYGAKNKIQSSALLSNAIAQDEEQQDQFQQPRHKNTSNFK